MHLWSDRILELIADDPTWDRGRDHVEADRGDVRQGLRDPASRLRAREGGGGATVDPDEPDLLPRRGSDHRARDPLRRSRAEHAGEGAGHDARACGPRGRDGRRRVNVNATVCFTVPQAIAVAEAIERGLRRREVGRPRRLAHCLRCDDDGRPARRLDRGARRGRGDLLTRAPHWAGIACLKRAYAIFQERGYRARLLAAAYRHHLHWSELIGGDVVLTIPYTWQPLFNDSSVEVSHGSSTPFR